MKPELGEDGEILYLKEKRKGPKIRIKGEEDRERYKNY